ncbi:DUF4405 domain-containing protein [Shumkonia mesophila]|uniref:DUF4405 domain-containing protein n=1 Tax=Shumkonia mesophila TaxID=2838854 RepID=UPI00293481DD|nr:DUF4405 domain-containing protein [Shumkonia mesophila]
MIATPYDPANSNLRSSRAVATRTLVATKAAGSPIQRYATAATASLFLVTGISGLLMFFHVGGKMFTSLHEWLGLLFVAAAALHVVRNGRGMVKLMKTARGWVLFGLTGIAAAAFIMASSGSSASNPVMDLVRAVEKAPIATVAPVLGVTVEDLAVRLRGAGVDVTGADQTFAELAAGQGTSSLRLLAAAVRPAARP